MAENLRTGLVWSTFMSNPECISAMNLAGFVTQCQLFHSHSR
jgi:hypothetical protein